MLARTFQQSACPLTISSYAKRCELLAIFRAMPPNYMTSPPSATSFSHSLVYQSRTVFMIHVENCFASYRSNSSLSDVVGTGAGGFPRLICTVLAIAPVDLCGGFRYVATIFRLFRHWFTSRYVSLRKAEFPLRFVDLFLIVCVVYNSIERQNKYT